MIQVRKNLKKLGKTVVLTNGCFDILHKGHIRLFAEAKRRGNILIVAVNTDATVRKLKGAARPIFPLVERMEVLEAVSSIDYLIPFAERTPRKIIFLLLPDVLVKGGDWKMKNVVGRKEVEQAGGQVVLFSYLPGFSTSSLIKRIATGQKTEL